MSELADRVRHVRDRIELINTDVDKPSALKDAPDLQWACGELEAIAKELDSPAESRRAGMLLHVLDREATAKERIELMQGALSDFLQARRAIVWDERNESLCTQLCAVGMDQEQVEAMLLKLAAEVHQQRTGTRAGAVIVESSQVTDFLLRLASLADRQ